MANNRARNTSIVFILILTVIICLIFFVFAYIQKTSNEERDKRTDQKFKSVEEHLKDAEQHIQKQDSIIHLLEEELRHLEKAR